MDAAEAKAARLPDAYLSYNNRDAIIYALGVGAQLKEDLALLYENHEDFKVIPTYVVSAALDATKHIKNCPGIKYDLPKILHGEQYIEMYEPLPTEANMRSEVRIIDILDKGSGALILSEGSTCDYL
ncbi:hypothetical protein L596_001507 [Steinernema carpocapsae]|uniref:Peroxisomal multifunctional enzyme type 2-like N-terminal domain-containing protein n=1 Tax=Steinernema carpocapsae TaxID=34508 RepID=A0A4U8ULF9_STECR|nr:hypothetical protein L596_001507 [Steinernema carpocapsae]